MKIGVIGAGTASAVSILSVFHALQQRPIPKDDVVTISCIYDPSIPITQVGESAGNAVQRLLFDVLDFDVLEDIDNFDGTLRWSTKYFWEEANNKNFQVKYEQPGFHLNSEKFSKYVVDQLGKTYGNFIEIHDSVSAITQTDKQISVVCKNKTYDFDFVINCSGTPTKEELDSPAYRAPKFESVNSVILFPHFEKYNESFTSSYVHKNGWMFGVPLQHRKAFGYLYNNKITTTDDALAHFAEIKGIDTSSLRKFSWKPYYKVEAMTGRELAMGNRLYFFEPHQAIPLHYYIQLTYEFMYNLTVTSDVVSNTNKHINKFHLDNMDDIQDLIALNYQGDNLIESEFWSYARDHAVNRLTNSITFKAWLHYVKIHGYTNFWCHSPSMMRGYVSGFGLSSKLRV